MLSAAAGRSSVNDLQSTILESLPDCIGWGGGVRLWSLRPERVVGRRRRQDVAE